MVAGTEKAFISVQLVCLHGRLLDSLVAWQNAGSPIAKLPRWMVTAHSSCRLAPETLLRVLRLGSLLDGNPAMTCCRGIIKVGYVLRGTCLQSVGSDILGSHLPACLQAQAGRCECATCGMPTG